MNNDQLQQLAEEKYPYYDSPLDGPIQWEKQHYEVNKFRAAYISGYTDAMKWVSVWDGLPNESHADQNGEIYVIGFEPPFIVETVFFDIKDKTFWIPFMGEKTYAITHWMPLLLPQNNNI